MHTNMQLQSIILSFYHHDNIDVYTFDYGLDTMYWTDTTFFPECTMYECAFNNG